MKTQNKKKIIVSTLALAMGAALAGSISGSVAWYQYSTRAAAQIAGTSAGTVGELQIRGAKHGQELDEGNDSNYLELGTENYKPMSMYIVDSETGAKKYVHNPVYQVQESKAYSESETPHYIDYDLQFKFEHRETDAALLAKNVYLSRLEIVAASDATADISKAVRVEFLNGDTCKAFLAKESAQVTDTQGQLDLNGNGVKDAMDFDCQDTNTTKINYMNKAETGLTYTTDAFADKIVDTTATNFDPYDIETLQAGKSLITTKDSDGGWSDTLTVRIWLEGWALLGASGSESADWPTDYIGQNFNVNMQFVCSAVAQ